MSEFGELYGQKVRAVFIGLGGKPIEYAPIVRCKDCIHYYTFACRMINPKETDFCNYGEKMPNLKCSSLTRKGERK